MSLPFAEQEGAVVELAEQETKSKTLVLIEDKLELLTKLNEFIDRFLASPVKDSDELKSESRELANKIAELFPRDDEFGYQSDKQLLFDVFFAVSYAEYKGSELCETKKRISNLRVQLESLKENVKSADEGNYAVGQIVLDVQSGTVHLVIGLKNDVKESTQELLLLSWEGTESIRSNKQVTLSHDANDYLFFMQQLSMHWRVYGRYNINSAWDEYTAGLEEEHGYFLQKRTVNPISLAYQNWSLLNTVVRKFSGSVR